MKRGSSSDPAPAAPAPAKRPRDAPPKAVQVTPDVAFLARQRKLGSLGGRCAGRLGAARFAADLAPDARAVCQLKTCKERLEAGALRLGKRPPS